MVLILKCQCTVKNEATSSCEAQHIALLLIFGLNWNLKAGSRFIHTIMR
ncbi:hypothetical protein NT01EI_2214 [Edwardsiella ictaluri 93-146]|uniref:Uncharacterized protein n=1 Tax=Edwardsiella ictaluri (strain 93-146) TaxID=634503 RepID=C5BFW1_EDWI9|nr:hypothetical protein NT01EI_2214 [Edwardsiella ictaluri 93-146]